MIALRDVLIFAGLIAIAAAFIASLFPVRQSFTPVPACSDCAFVLNGPYRLVQYGNYAALMLGQQQVAQYGWAYAEGRPLSPGEAVFCNPMYVWVIGGIAYASCTGRAPALGLNYTASYTAPSYLAPITIVVDDRPNAQWTITWSGGASGSRSGSASDRWTIYADGPVSLSAKANGCYIAPSATTAYPGQTVTFEVVCPRYLELDITYYMGYPWGGRNNVHVVWNGGRADFYNSTSPARVALWIDLTTGQWTTQKPPSVTCNSTTPANVQKYWQIYGGGGYLAYLNVWTSGNEVSFRGDGYLADYGFTAAVQGLDVTVYVEDAWMMDWGQGADVYFYFCK